MSHERQITGDISQVNVPPSCNLLVQRDFFFHCSFEFCSRKGYMGFLHFCNFIWIHFQVNFKTAEDSHLASWLAFVQLLSCALLFAAPRTAIHQASLSFAISWSLLRLMPIESVMPSNHLVLCRLFSSCPQSFPASGSFLVSQLFASVSLH